MSGISPHPAARQLIYVSKSARLSWKGL